MTCSKYLRGKGCFLPLTLIGRLMGYTDVGLTNLYKSEFDRFERLVFEAENRFNSICKNHKNDRSNVGVISSDEMFNGLDTAIKSSSKDANFNQGFSKGVKFAEKFFKFYYKTKKR